jgi:hypothetical protein
LDEIGVRRAQALGLGVPMVVIVVIVDALLVVCLRLLGARPVELGLVA